MQMKETQMGLNNKEWNVLAHTAEKPGTYLTAAGAAGSKSLE